MKLLIVLIVIVSASANPIEQDEVGKNNNGTEKEVKNIIPGIDQEVGSTNPSIGKEVVNAVGECQGLGAVPPILTSGCCGLQIPPTKDLSGANTEIDQFPWVVKVVIADERRVILGYGGALISSRYVLTAGHCLNDPLVAANIRVIAAEFDTRHEENCVIKDKLKKCSTRQIFNVEDVIRHPNYFKNKTGLANDIAILRLTEDVPYTNFIRPICLPTFNIDDEANKNLLLLVSGFGLTGPNEKALIKQYTVVNLTTSSNCNHTATSSFVDLSDGTFVCVLSQKEQPKCAGDSGSPLMMYKDGRYVLVGLGSTGAPGCGVPKTIGNYPDLYTNVFHYLPWIRSHIGM